MDHKGESEIGMTTVFDDLQNEYDSLDVLFPLEYDSSVGLRKDVLDPLEDFSRSLRNLYNSFGGWRAGVSDEEDERYAARVLQLTRIVKAAYSIDAIQMLIRYGNNSPFPDDLTQILVTKISALSRFSRNSVNTIVQDVKRIRTKSVYDDAVKSFVSLYEPSAYRVDLSVYQQTEETQEDSDTDEEDLELPNLDDSDNEGLSDEDSQYESGDVNSNEDDNNDSDAVNSDVDSTDVDIDESSVDEPNSNNNSNEQKYFLTHEQNIVKVSEMAEAAEEARQSILSALKEQSVSHVVGIE
jgi:asparagine/aspartate rich protein, putative